MGISTGLVVSSRSFDGVSYYLTNLGDGIFDPLSLITFVWPSLFSGTATGYTYKSGLGLKFCPPVVPLHPNALEISGPLGFDSVLDVLLIDLFSFYCIFSISS